MLASGELHVLLSCEEAQEGELEDERAQGAERNYSSKSPDAQSSPSLLGRWLEM